MLTLPEPYCTLLGAFAPVFSQRIWSYVPTLVLGAILAPGQRTVAAVLRVMGLSQEVHFQNYHRVLNRAVWSSREIARLLLHLLVLTFAATGPLVFGLDDTIERRRGAKITAKGIYRDPVRSSHGHFVKASGLRWLSLMLLAPIPWAQRVWALPFLTVLCPSERYDKTRRYRHKTLTDWARQTLLQVRRWLPDRALVVVADNSFAVITLLKRLQGLAQSVTMITRFRLDAALYEPAPVRQPGQKGRPRVKGKRLPTLEQMVHDAAITWTSVTLHNWYGGVQRVVEIVSGTAVWYHAGMPPLPLRWVLIRDPAGVFKPQALLCTDLMANPVQIVTWFVMRWQLEVTFHEVRAHLGVETQRQWSDQAIARTTPALLGLFSLVTLAANCLTNEGTLPVAQAAWYAKALPTFADALAVVRQDVWQKTSFPTSCAQTDIEKTVQSLLARCTEAICYM